jgi:hypothetical protein
MIGGFRDPSLKTTSGDRSTPTSLGPRQPRAEAGKQARKSQIQDLVRRGDIKNSQTAYPLILASARNVGGAALPSWFGFAPLAPRETPKIAPRKMSPVITEACSPGKASPEGLAGTEAGDRSGTTSTSLASKQSELPKVELRFLKPRPRPTARSLVLADGKSGDSAGSIGNSESNERWLGQTGDGTIGFTLWFLTLQPSRPTPLDLVQLAAGRHSIKPALVKLTAPDVAVESSFAKASTFANLSSVASTFAKATLDKLAKEEATVDKPADGSVDPPAGKSPPAKVEPQIPKTHPRPPALKLISTKGKSEFAETSIGDREKRDTQRDIATAGNGTNGLSLWFLTLAPSHLNRRAELHCAPGIGGLTQYLSGILRLFRERDSCRCCREKLFQFYHFPRAIGSGN